MVSKKKLKRENKSLKKQLKELKELQALTQNNFLDLIAYKQNNESKINGQSIVDIGHRTRDRIEGPDELVFGQTCGGKSPVFLNPLCGVRTRRMQSGTSLPEGVSKTVGRIELVRTLLRVPNAVPHIKGTDDRVSLIEPHYASIVKQLEKDVLPILDAHLSGTKLIDFDNIPQEVFNYIWIVSNEQNGDVNPISTIGSFLLEKPTSGKSLKELNKEMGSPSISEIFPDSTTPSIKECNEQMIQESKGLESDPFDVPYTVVEASTKIYNERKPNQQNLQQGDANSPHVVGSVLFEEGNNSFACEVPVYSTSLKNVLTDAGIFISPKEYTPIIFDYLHSLDNSKPVDKITLKEKKHHMRVLVDKIAKQSKVKTETNIFTDVLLERGLLITSDGDTSVVTIAKSKSSITPFQA